jgi:hypothetical protein
MLTISNPNSITSISITIHVAANDVWHYSGQYDTIGNGVLSFSESGSSNIQANWSASGGTNASPLITAGYNPSVALQLSGGSVAHDPSGDTWSITTTSNGVTSTVSGSF